MKKLTKGLIRKAASYARDFFDRNENADFIFHNFKHTKRVARSAKRIASHTQIDRHDYIVLMVAAWFHDTGYLAGTVNHENKSAALAEKFLLSHHIHSGVIQAVRNAILATRMPQNPTNIVEQILCDADLYHFGSKQFIKLTGNLRNELQILTGQDINKEKWFSETTELIQSHAFFTSYASKKIRPGVARNLKMLRKKQRKASLANAEKLINDEKEFSLERV